jgi:ssDNA-binding replication factor A large subunit
MDEDHLIPKAYTAFNFTKIDKLNEKATKSFIDIVGIVSKCEDAITTVVKNEQRERRQIELVDDSGVRVFTTFWGIVLMQRLKQIKLGDVLALRQVRVGDFNGRSLTASDMVEDIFTDVKHPR